MIINAKERKEKHCKYHFKIKQIFQLPNFHSVNNYREAALRRQQGAQPSHVSSIQGNMVRNE